MCDVILSAASRVGGGEERGEKGRERSEGEISAA
jgi:hypothetical protein